MSTAREATGWEKTQEVKSLLGLATEEPTFAVDTEANRPRLNAIGIEVRSLMGMHCFFSPKASRCRSRTKPRAG